MPSTPSWELSITSVSLLGPWTLCLPLPLPLPPEASGWVCCCSSKLWSCLTPSPLSSLLESPTQLPSPPTPALPSPGRLPTVLPGALQPQLPWPEDKSLQD